MTTRTASAGLSTPAQGACLILGFVFDPEVGREARAKRRGARAKQLAARAERAEKRFQVLEEIATAVSEALEPLTTKVPSEHGGVTIRILADNTGLDDIILRLDKNDVRESAEEETPTFDGRAQIRARRQRRKPLHQGRKPPQPCGL
jgi:hypothetical protein